jgi:glycosyltransferase involved in cell wall biosynthesis
VPVASIPILSVLMPVYNAERYVAEAVDSILAQTFHDFEFLIINDGSTDGSGAILSRYAERDPRIRLVSRPNIGIVGTLNQLVEMARGEFLGRMDADDIALPDRFKLQVDYLRAHPECLAVGSRVLAVDAEGDPLCEWSCEQTHEEITAELLSTRGHNGIIHPAVMMRREAVLAVGKYREFFVEDKDLFLRLGEHGLLANLPQVLLHYRQNPSSVCNASGNHRASLDQSVHRVVLEAYERRGLDINQVRKPTSGPPRTPAETHRVFGWWALMAGHVRTARKHARARFCRAPLSIDSWRLLYCAMRGY